MNYDTKKERLLRQRRDKGISAFDVVNPYVITVPVLIAILQDSFTSITYEEYISGASTNSPQDDLNVICNQCHEFFCNHGLHNVSHISERTKAIYKFLGK